MSLLPVASLGRAAGNATATSVVMAQLTELAVSTPSPTIVLPFPHSSLPPLPSPSPPLLVISHHAPPHSQCRSMVPLIIGSTALRRRGRHRPLYHGRWYHTSVLPPLPAPARPRPPAPTHPPPVPTARRRMTMTLTFWNSTMTRPPTPTPMASPLPHVTRWRSSASSSLWCPDLKPQNHPCILTSPRI